jgi:hypothetical protein
MRSLNKIPPKTRYLISDILLISALVFGGGTVKTHIAANNAPPLTWLLLLIIVLVVMFAIWLQKDRF